MTQNVATWTEIIKLELRVAELESAFRHYHANNGSSENDLCKVCKLDLRDPIHIRIPNPHYKPTEGD